MSSIFDPAYKDQYGLTTLTPGNSTQNGVLFSMEQLILGLANNDSAADSRSAGLVSIFQSLEQKAPGLQQRTPDSFEYDSQDNYSARLAFSLINKDDQFGQRMYDYSESSKSEFIGYDSTSNESASRLAANKTEYPLARILGLGKIKYCYNQSHPREFCGLGWFQWALGLMALMDYSRRGWTTPLRFIGLTISQMMGMFSSTSNLDARKLAYVVWYPLSKRNLYWKILYKIWCWKLMKDYPEGMKTVYEQYFQDPNNPIRAHAIPHF